jgi:hypothetical protein
MMIIGIVIMGLSAFSMGVSAHYWRNRCKRLTADLERLKETRVIQFSDLKESYPAETTDLEALIKRKSRLESYLNRGNYQEYEKYLTNWHNQRDLLINQIKNAQEVLNNHCDLVSKLKLTEGVHGV